MNKLTGLLALLLLLVGVSAAHAQAQPAAGPVSIAIFPFKNLSGEVKYDSLSWAYADSLYAFLMAQPGSGTDYALVTMDDVRDQMLAQNVDIKSPSYETDVWNLAKLLGAKRLVWGTYFVKYEKANLEAKVVDVKTAMPNNTHYAEKIRPYYNDALVSVPTLAQRIIPAMK